MPNTSRTNTADALTHLVREFVLDRDTKPRTYTWAYGGETFQVTVSRAGQQSAAKEGE